MIPDRSRFVDRSRLVALAKHYHVTIRVLRRVGHFVPAGIPLMMVSKGSVCRSKELPSCLPRSTSARPER